MFDQGQPVGLEVLWPVEVSGPWDTLAATAASWASESSAAAAQMEQAASAWGGLVSSYRDTATEQVVYSALDEAPGVTGQWADVAARAADVLQAFATEASGLEQQALGLRSQAAKLEARLWASDLFTGGGSDGDSAEDQALLQAVHAHNSEVLSLNSRWQQVEQQAASDIDAISASGGGYQDEIPAVTADGGTFGTGAGGFGTGGFGVAGLGLAGLGAGGLGLGALNAGAGLGVGFHAAVGQMIRSGHDADTDDPVETATELYETATSDEVTGEDMTRFYDHLADMDADQIEEFAEANPSINQYSMPQPANEEQLASWPTGADGDEWWNSMGSPEQDMNSPEQKAMVAFLPLLTGNTQGVPAQKRHDANMNALDTLRRSGEYRDYERHLNSIEDSALPEDDESGQRFLLSLDVGTAGERDRQPLAAVAVGDPDQASEVTYNVPGMNSGTDNMTGEVDRAQDIFDEASNQAVIAWMGYDPPTTEETIPESLDGFWDEDDGLNISWDEVRDFEGAPHEELFGQDGSVMSDVRADEGSYRFAYAIDGQQSASAARGDETVVNVVAHSYGTNMTAHALTLDNQQSTVDKVFFMGSSGIPASAAVSADELNVEETEEGEPAVFVTEAEADGLAHMGRGVEVNGPFRDDPYVVVPEDVFAAPRVDPRSEEFNAYVYSSDAEEPFWPWSEEPEEKSVTDHTRYDTDPDTYGYQDPETLSFESKIAILNGDMRSVEFERTPTNGSE